MNKPFVTNKIFAVKWLISLLLQWVDDAGGIETLGKTLLRRKKTEEVPQFIPPEVNAITGFTVISFSCKSFKLWFHLRSYEGFVS